MVKNIFEEFAWRGYLASRLENLGSRPFFNSLITGLIWVSWHIPYYLFFLNRADLERQTTLSIPALILLGYILMSCQSLLYNELRLISGSVWPAWLLHTAANAFSFALVTGGFVAVSGKLTHLIFTPGTEGILYSILAGLVGWALHRRRMKTA
jgi:membrane protease YdiL (CAAX protease family)